MQCNCYIFHTRNEQKQTKTKLFKKLTSSSTSSDLFNARVSRILVDSALTRNLVSAKGSSPSYSNKNSTKKWSTLAIRGSKISELLWNTFSIMPLRSSRLNIGFSASNPLTDPSFSSSRSRDPPLTSHRRWVGRIGWFGRVGRISVLFGHPYLWLQILKI